MYLESISQLSDVVESLILAIWAMKYANEERGEEEDKLL